MFLRLKKDILPLFLTCLIFVILQTLVTTLLPALGVSSLSISFHILIVLFMGLKLDTPWIGLFVFLIMYLNSFFMVEGWEFATVTGIAVCFLISYLRSLVHLTSIGFIMGTFISLQVIWFFIESLLLYMKMDNWEYLGKKLLAFIPESIIVMIMSPLLFYLLEKIWQSTPDFIVEENS